MTPEEFTEKMKAVMNEDESEAYMNCRLDEIMEECLVALGYAEGVEIANEWRSMMF